MGKSAEEGAAEAEAKGSSGGQNTQRGSGSIANQHRAADAGTQTEAQQEAAGGDIVEGRDYSEDPDSDGRKLQLEGQMGEVCKEKEKEKEKEMEKETETEKEKEKEKEMEK